LNESVHIHGGIGFTFDYDLHLFLKRGKLFEYAAGDATWHREQYARAVIDGAPACS
jgi:alkylation response protein AidB-like acyl-CoA dehydrogenase